MAEWIAVYRFSIHLPVVSASPGRGLRRVSERVIDSLRKPPWHWYAGRMQQHPGIPDLVDIHCHLLPSVDDGAQDLQAGLGLAKASVIGRITTAVLTPHGFPGRFDDQVDTLRPDLEAFRRAIDSAGIALTVHLGGEVHLTPETLEMAVDGRAPMLGGWQGAKLMLLEFPDGHIP